MSDEEIEESSVPAVSPLRSSGPAIALALCLIAIATASLLGTPNRGTDIEGMKDKVQLQPPNWRPSKTENDRLNSLAETRRGYKLDANDPLAKRLLERMEEFHRIVLIPGANRRSPAYQDAHAQYTQRARDFLRHRGQEGYLALGQRMVDQYIRALRADDKATVERLGGRFYRHAKSSRLIHDSGIAGPAQEHVLRLALMEEWLRPIGSTQVVATWTDALERIVLRRWLLAAQNLKPERRMELSRELVRLQSAYPVWWAMAGHAAEVRDWAAAAMFFERALAADPDNRTLELNLKYAQERARRNHWAVD